MGKAGSGKKGKQRSISQLSVEPDNRNFHEFYTDTLRKDESADFELALRNGQHTHHAELKEKLDCPDRTCGRSWFEILALMGAEQCSCVLFDYMASQELHLPIVEELDCENYSILHRLAIWNRTIAIRKILDHCIPHLFIKNAHGETPYESAYRMQCKDAYELLEWGMLRTILRQKLTDLQTLMANKDIIKQMAFANEDKKALDAFLKEETIWQNANINNEKVADKPFEELQDRLANFNLKSSPHLRKMLKIRREMEEAASQAQSIDTTA